MPPSPCPHCNTLLRQTRTDGRCAVCGQPLPEALRGPPSRAPWIGDPRSMPILDVAGRAAFVTAPLPGSSSPEPAPEPLQPVLGIENTVPWPIPFPQPAAFLTFWGAGDQTTQPFVLDGDGAMRITIESGLLQLRVLCPDGSEVGNPTTMAGPGLALDSIPAGGTFVLAVRASARWGITVVHYMLDRSAEQPSAPGVNPTGDTNVVRRKPWWRFW